MNIADLRQAANIDDFEASLLLSYVLRVSKAYLIAHAEEEVASRDQERFLQLVARREKGEPIAYILGRKEFFSLDFLVNSHTLIPRPETELIIEIVREKMSSALCWNILELGTGSGAISLVLGKLYPLSHIVASEVDEQTLAVAAKNKFNHRIANVDFVLSDWFSKLSGKFHAIISNPPYLSSNDPHLKEGDIRFEPQKALIAGETGLEAYQAILQKAGRYLVEDGYIFLEHGFDQGEQVQGLLQQKGFKNIETRKDLNGLGRVTFGCYSGIN